MTTILAILKYFSIGLTGLTGILGLFFNFHEDEDPTGRRRLNRWGRTALVVLVVSLSATVMMQVVNDLQEESRQSSQLARQTEVLQDIRRAVYPLNDLSGTLEFEVRLNDDLRNKLPPLIRTPGLLSSFGDPKDKSSLAFELGRLYFNLEVGDPAPGAPRQRDMSLTGNRLLSNIDRLATDYTPYRAFYSKSKNGAPDRLVISLPLGMSNNSGRFFALNELGGQPVEVTVGFGGDKAMAICKVKELILSSARTGLAHKWDLSKDAWKSTPSYFGVDTTVLKEFPPLSEWATASEDNTK